jgi:hypothetical protein
MISTELYESCMQIVSEIFTLSPDQFQNLLEEFFVHVEQVKHARHTDVLYVYWGSAISPIMKADGTCLTLTEWKENHNIKD